MTHIRILRRYSIPLELTSIPNHLLPTVRSAFGLGGADKLIFDFNDLPYASIHSSVMLFRRSPWVPRGTALLRKTTPNTMSFRALANRQRYVTIVAIGCHKNCNDGTTTAYDERSIIVR